jgi:hypothetical protein
MKPAKQKNQMNSSIELLPPGTDNITIIADGDNHFYHADGRTPDDLLHFYLCWKRQSCDACLAPPGKGKGWEDLECSWCPFVGLIFFFSCLGRKVLRMQFWFRS